MTPTSGEPNTSASSSLQSFPTEADISPLRAALTDTSTDPTDAHIAPHFPIHHLFECSWNHFLSLEPPHTGVYDYIDGLVVWIPPMASAPHNILSRSHGTLLECGSGNFKVDQYASLQVKSPNGTMTWTTDWRQDPKSQSEPTSGDQFGLRHPDFVVCTPKADDDGSSSTSRDAQVKKRIEYPYPCTKRLVAVGEVISPSTCSVDYDNKWKLYANSGIPRYIILDNGETKKKAKPRVVIGDQNHFFGAQRSTRGDVQQNPACARITRSTRTQNVYFYRRAYTEDEIVDHPLYAHLKKTAVQLVNFELMAKLATKLFNDRGNQRDRADQESARADRAEENFGQERTRADRAEERLDRYRRKYGETPPASPPSQSSVLERDRKSPTSSRPSRRQKR